MNRLISLVGAALLVGLSTLASVVGCGSSQPPAQAVADYPIPFCRVISECGGGPSRTLCSGTLVDRTATKGLVITCNHCTRSGGPYRVKFTNGEEHVAELLRTDAQQDLAALSIAAPKVQAVKCGSFTGQGIYRAYGFGGDGQFSCVEGRVVEQYGTIGSTGHSFQGITGVPISGDSGSGTVNDNGEFCGVLWGSGSGQGLITMGAPVSDFLRALVADGKWAPSGTFTPGGRPVYDPSNVDSGVRMAASEDGYSIDGHTREIVDAQGRHVTATLTGFLDQLGCPGGGCFRCPPHHDEPGGRRPIRDPIEIAPNPTINVGPTVDAGGELLGLVLAVALIGGVFGFAAYLHHK